MNTTPRSDRFHIAVVGRRNVGKSSLINAIANQDIALVSSTPGTTTDPVYKSMELLPFGPVVLVDTAGIDDTGELGEQRIKRSYAVLGKADLILLVTDATNQAPAIGEYEERIVRLARSRDLPLVVAVNKLDTPEAREACRNAGHSLGEGIPVCPVSAISRGEIDGLLETIKKVAEDASQQQSTCPIIGDLVNPGDTVILVCPIDAEAPKTRLILPQVQTIRDLLDHDAIAMVVQPNRLPDALKNLQHPPALVVTDSQAFKEVSGMVPPTIPLTSFSILFARHRGDLGQLLEGIEALDSLRPGDRILIAEACTHHPVGEDIGRVKIPRWLEQRVGDLEFEWCVGGDFPADLSRYSLIIHCGGCMINRKLMLSRLAVARSAGVPITNYGLFISHVHGILPRATEVFGASSLRSGWCRDDSKKPFADDSDYVHASHHIALEA